jgi:hypothetical protein
MPTSNNAETIFVQQTDPTPGVMTVATGIPPHVGTAQQLVNILNVMTELVQKFGEHGRRQSDGSSGRGIGHKSVGIGSCYREPLERDIGEFTKKIVLKRWTVG